jgi:hypothetical protein
MVRRLVRLIAMIVAGLALVMVWLVAMGDRLRSHSASSVLGRSAIIESIQDAQRSSGRWPASKADILPYLPENLAEENWTIERMRERHAAYRLLVRGRVIHLIIK